MKLNVYKNRLLIDTENAEKNYLTEEETMEFQAKMYEQYPSQNYLMEDQGIGEDKVGYYRIKNPISDDEIQLLLMFKIHERLGTIKTILQIFLGMVLVPLIIYLILIMVGG